MPPKDGSKDSESKKTKRWTPVPRLPGEDARNDNVPKLPRKPKKNQRNKKQTAKADEELVEEKLDKPSEKLGDKSKARWSGRRKVQRRGPPAKKVEERSETTPHEDNEAKTKREEPSEKKTPGHNGKTLNGSAGEGEGRGGLPEAVPSEVDLPEVDEIPERLFRCFFSQRTDMQAFVGIMRIFQNDTDKTLQRIHHLVITMLLDDFQSFPYWPEKELLMVGELLGQFIRWDLIPDGGPLQLALCCILSALKESPTSLLYRFGQRALEQFLCRFAHHDVASQMCMEMQMSRAPLHEEEIKHEERCLHLNPVMFPAQPVFLPWPWFPPMSQPDLVMRMLIPQAHPVPAPAPTRAHNAGRPKVGQQELSKWMFGHPSKAASRPAGSKQGILGWQEPEKERREKEKDAGKTSKKKTSAKSKKTNVESGQKAGPSSGTTPLPSFIEVDMESMEFQLSDEDVADMQVRREEKKYKENEENEEKEKEDEAELDLSGDTT